jgi:hypothetical protein
MEEVQFVILHPEVNSAMIHPYMEQVFPDQPYRTRTINKHLVATPTTAFTKEHYSYARALISSFKLDPDLEPVDDYECVNAQHIGEHIECYCGLDSCELASQYYMELTNSDLTNNKRVRLCGAYYRPYKD